MKNGKILLARKCYENAISTLGEDGHNADLLLKFAEFEEMVNEIERSRTIYK